MNTTTTIGSWSETTMAALQQVWIGFINLLPLVLAAILVLVVGILVAKAVRTLLRALGNRLKLDDALERTGVPERVRRGGLNFSFSALLGAVGFWLVMLLTLTVMADTLHWTMLGSFLRSVVAYTPHVLVAMAILTVGFLVARILHDLTEGAVRAAGMPDAASETIAAIARVSVLVFSVMAALTQLGVASDLIKILFSGIVIAAALGVGLAFGLGGRDQAQRLIERMTQGMSPQQRPMEGRQDYPPANYPRTDYPRTAAGD